MEKNTIFLVATMLPLSVLAEGKSDVIFSFCPDVFVLFLDFPDLF